MNSIKNKNDPLYQWKPLGSLNENLMNKVYILTQINPHLIQEEHK